MLVRFRNFWNTFDEEDNFFIKYLEHHGYEPRVSSKKREVVDLEIESVFFSGFQKGAITIDRKLKSKSYFNLKLLRRIMQRAIKSKSYAKKRLWFTGENIRPPYEQNFDRYLSFDQFNFNNQNFYFPLWYTHLDWFGKPEFNSRIGAAISTSKLLLPRRLIEDKRKFAVVFLSNPHSYRLEFIRKLREHFEIDVFGNLVGKPVKHKLDVSKNYQYTICFENDSFPGYVTEKLLEAYMSDTVPIYWGDFGIEKIFNENAFINLSQFENLDSIVLKLKSLNYQAIYEQPLLNYKVDPTPFREFISEFLKDS